MEYTAEQYELLYQPAEGPVTEQMLGMSRVKAQRTRTVKAGDMLYVTCYPIWRNQREAHRARDRKPSRAAQVKLNQRRRRMKVEQLAHANFGRDDYYLTLTYTETPRQGKKLTDEYWQDEPQDLGEAKKCLAAYIKRLKGEIKRRGGDPRELKYIGCTEETWSRHADAYDDHARYHHHMLLSRSVLTRDEIEDVWKQMGHGNGRTNCQRIQPDGAGIAALANYLMKSESGRPSGEDSLGRPRYEHSYTASRNLIKPTESASDHKISRRRVARVARDVLRDGMEIFRAMYPGYEPTEAPRVYISDYVAGAYIYCRLRRKE